ncbi:MAG: thioredoxin family protein [Bacteroidia bacterium]
MKSICIKTAMLFPVLFFILNSCTGQEAEKKINWMSFEEAVKKSETQPKKIFIDVYTGWCGWCKKMDKSTFLNDTVADYMNKNYYAVKLDAETKDTIHFRDKDFVFKPEYKSNELAISLLNGKMSYPSFIFLDESVNILSPIAGFQTPQQLIPVMKYFGENIYKNKKWEEYMNELSGPK